MVGESFLVKPYQIYLWLKLAYVLLGWETSALKSQKIHLSKLTFLYRWV